MNLLQLLNDLLSRSFLFAQVGLRRKTSVVPSTRSNLFILRKFKAKSRRLTEIKIKISHKTCDNKRFCKKKTQDKEQSHRNMTHRWRQVILSNANEEKITDDIYREQRCETTLECAEQKKGVTRPKFLRERSLFKSSGWSFSIIHLINSVHKLFIALL